MATEKEIVDAASQCARLLHRTISSHATMPSAIEVAKVSDVLKDRVANKHLSEHSALRSIFAQLVLPEGFNLDNELPRMAKSLADQTTVNIETVVSAATVLLSHSTADDVFTGACEVCLRLDPKAWASELNPKRTVTLAALIENGIDSVLAEEYEHFRVGMRNKSLPNRADMLFRHVPVRQNKQIAATDSDYFSMSSLKEADDLRHSIVHGGKLPRIDFHTSYRVMSFLHEAATVALRSIIDGYLIPVPWSDVTALFTAKGQAGG